MKANIILTDTFNGAIISRHSTIVAAVRAQRKHLRAVKKANGSSSYLTYSITGPGCDPESITEARIQVNNESL
jgi:hypothetical protein